MARIRSVKPQLRTSLTVSEWPREVRYAWVLLWGYLDDYGFGIDDLRLITADLFPLDRDVTERKMNGWLGRFTDSGALCRYEVDGRSYLHSVNWADHQKPAHPTASKCPPCPVHGMTEWPAKPGRPPKGSRTTPEEFTNDSGNDPEEFANDSRSDQEQFMSSRAPAPPPAETGDGRRETGTREPRAADEPVTLTRDQPGGNAPLDPPPDPIVQARKRAGLWPDRGIDTTWTLAACKRVILRSVAELDDVRVDDLQDAWDRLAVLAALRDTQGPARLTTPAGWELAGRELRRIRTDDANRQRQAEEREARQRGVNCEHGAPGGLGCAFCRTEARSA